MTEEFNSMEFANSMAEEQFEQQMGKGWWIDRWKATFKSLQQEKERNEVIVARHKIVFDKLCEVLSELEGEWGRDSCDDVREALELGAL
jgi:hypothetical protein